MTVSISFQSAHFAPTLSEGAQVNDGAYGFELALFLAKALSASGVIVSYPLAEDWGWFLDVRSCRGVSMRVGCIVKEAPAAAGPLSWEVFVQPTPHWLQRLQRKPVNAEVNSIAARVKDAIRGVDSTVQWAG